MKTSAILATSILLLACEKSSRAPLIQPGTDTKSSAAPPTVTLAPTPSVVAPPANSAPTSVAEWVAKFVPLPGATGPVSLDYIAYDRYGERVWVPVGDTGSADAFDITSGTFTRVEGFKVTEREHRGKMRKMGPSAASVGDGVVYIGNRGTSEVCPIDAKTLKLGKCLKLPTPTDGVVYVASAKEVWVTTPRDQSLTVLDAAKPGALTAKLVIRTPGETEGYSVDDARGLFYTNLEDKNRTLVVDIKTHTVKANWAAGCGDDGPRGLAVDSGRQFVFVACTSSVQILDGGHGGAPLGRLETGAGVDNIDYLESTHTLVVAAARAAKLTVARIDDKGQPSIIATATTVEGARNAVVDANGNIYLAEPVGARLMVFAAPH